MRKTVLLTLGFLFLILGGIGIALPVLPTTPFVLSAAGCFGASSPKLYQKLSGTKYFGEYIRNYKSKEGISDRTRWTGIIFLWLTLGVSMIFAKRPVIILILALVGIAVTIHLLMIRRKK